MCTKIGCGLVSRFTLSEAGKSQVPTCGKEHTNKYRNQDGRMDDLAPLSYRGLLERTVDQEAVMVANESWNTKEKQLPGKAAGP